MSPAPRSQAGPDAERAASGSELERIAPARPLRTDPADVLFGVVRLTTGLWLRSASFGLGVTLRLARAAQDPRQAAELASEIGGGLRSYAREVLGVADLDERLRALMPTGGRAAATGTNGASETEALRARGAELLRQSADVNVDQAGHPAYARILEELAPDEARILRLLYTDGPQASVDVRSSQLLGIASELVAEGLNMIGAQAGVRHAERVPAYLNNLNRLGLIWFSKEPLDEPIAYQVLEAQPSVLGALKRAARARTVQRSIRLTPFGRDFCEVVLPLERVETGEVIGTA